MQIGLFFSNELVRAAGFFIYVPIIYVFFVAPYIRARTFTRYGVPENNEKRVLSGGPYKGSGSRLVGVSSVIPVRVLNGPTSSMRST